MTTTMGLFAICDQRHSRVPGLGEEFDKANPADGSLRRGARKYELYEFRRKFFPSKSKLARLGTSKFGILRFQSMQALKVRKILRVHRGEALTSLTHKYLWYTFNSWISYNKFHAAHEAHRTCQKPRSNESATQG